MFLLIYCCIRSLSVQYVKSGFTSGQWYTWVVDGFRYKRCDRTIQETEVPRAFAISDIQSSSARDERSSECQFVRSSMTYIYYWFISPFSDRVGLPLHNILSPFIPVMNISVDLKFCHVHFYTLQPCPSWSSNRSSAFNAILYTFLHPVLVTFPHHMTIPYHLKPSATRDKSPRTPIWIRFMHMCTGQSLPALLSHRHHMATFQSLR